MGGSATVDGGIGALGALGMKFYDSASRAITPHGNEACAKIRRIDPTDFIARCKNMSISFACDVNSPLLGPIGAAVMFGPQKMSPAMRSDPAKLEELVMKLENGLKNVSQVMVEAGGRDVSGMEGVGAAGGFALGFCSFLGSKTENGADLVMRAIDFGKYRDYDVAYTCEGICDSQTLRGKGPYAVCKWLRDPYVVVLCGAIENERVEREMLKAGANLVLPLADKPCSLDSSISRTEELMRRAAFRSFYSFLCTRTSHM
jgi:glycerate kinase